jgi:hypothetical protein
MAQFVLPYNKMLNICKGKLYDPDQEAFSLENGALTCYSRTGFRILSGWFLSAGTMIFLVSP